MGDAEAPPIRAGDRVQLGHIVGTVLRVQSPRRMLRVHGRADHPGLCLVKWDKDGSGGEHWYEAIHLTVVRPAPGRLDRIRGGLRRLLRR